MKEYIVIIWTAKNRQEVEKVAKIILENRTAACVNVIPGVFSFYTWKGKIECSQEVKVFIKSKKSLFSAVRDAILDHASYDVPEILAVDVSFGLTSYLDWVDSVTK